MLDIKLRVLSRLSGALPLRERVTSFLHGLYYLQGLGTALAVALLSFMLIAGRTPAVFAVGTGRRMLVTFAIVRLSDIFRQVFFLQPKREWGLHWRAGILRMVKWPYVLLALGDVLTRANRGYTLTRKVRSARRRFAAMPAHLLVAGIVGTAWAIGAARGVSGAALTAIASVVIGLSLLCALTEIRRFPPPYDEQLAASELADT